ncbi:MAG: cell division protein FtsK [Streptosporangiales bacterium]|nr:cell division protein FtsK [Streptosporangiales bacterium]
MSSPNNGSHPGRGDLVALRTGHPVPDPVADPVRDRDTYGDPDPAADAPPDRSEGPGGDLVPFTGQTGPEAETVAPLDVSFEVELDSDGPGRAEPVDDGLGFVLPDTEGDAYPVVPEHLRSLWGIRDAVARHARRLTHRAAFHGLRLPRYALLALLWGSVGVLRLTGRVIAWWWLPNSDFLMSTAAARGDSREWLKILRETKWTRRVRGIGLAFALFATLIGGWVLAALAPGWVWAVLAALALPGLAHLGRPQDRPIIVPAMTVPRFRLINADVVLRAYYAAGLGHPEKPGQQVEFETTLSRSKDGEGSEVKVVLPYGLGYGDVVKAKDAVASGLDVAPSQVYLTRDKTSHRRHLLLVTDRDPLAIPAGLTPLLDCKPRSIWQPAPFGLDERGRKVTVALLWVSLLVGAQPRKGKTFAARLLALYAALDPSVRISVVDGKKSPDWNRFRLVAYHFIRGQVPDRDGDPVSQLIDALSEVKQHIIETNDFLAGLSSEECPEGKLTPELCRKYPKRLFVWLLVMEEFQTYFELPDQEANKEIANLLSFIMAVGPSSGVTILSSSQKPSGIGAGDVQRLFNRYRDNHAVRFALKCGNRVVSDAILGGDAYAEGYDASTLPVGDEYRGVGYLYGASDATPTVRTFLADHQHAEKILTAARRLRERAGTIAGYAAGEDTGIATLDVLADVLDAFGADRALHWNELADRLAAQLPDRWADAGAESISAQCRQLGVRSVDVKRSGAVLKGCRRDAVEAAQSGRDNA